jgi:hypothetical protein
LLWDLVRLQASSSRDVDWDNPTDAALEHYACIAHITLAELARHELLCGTNEITAEKGLVLVTADQRCGDSSETAERLAAIERGLTELGLLFGVAASMIAEQDRLVDRLDGEVGRMEERVREVRTQLIRHYDPDGAEAWELAAPLLASSAAERRRAAVRRRNAILLGWLGLLSLLRIIALFVE